MPEFLTADPFGALTAFFTGLLFVATGALAFANWQAATAATEKLTVITDSGGLHFDLHFKVVQTPEEALVTRCLSRFARYRPPRSS